MRTMRSMARAVGMAAGLTALLVPAVPAGATHGGIHPTFRSERVYFHCEGAAKIQNATLPAPWDTTAPAGPVTGGGGCGSVDPAFLQNVPGGPLPPAADAGFNGTFTGNIKNMTVELWILGHGANTAQNNTLAAEVSLFVDGQELMLRARQTVPLTASSSGASRVARFTITGLGCAKEVLDTQGNVVDVKTGGLATEDGNGAEAHDVTLWVATGGPVAVLRAEVLAWVWDTTDVPSGITFNDPTPQATTVQPAAPATC